MTKLGRFSRRKWARRFVRGFGYFILILLAGALVTRYVIRYRGQQKLAEQVAKLDANDPRWRWEDIEDDRPAIPDAENSASLVPKVIEARGGNRDFEVKWDKRSKPSTETTPNRFLTHDDAEAVHEAMKDQEDALVIARSFQNYPRGRHTLTLRPDTPMAETPHLNPTRTVASLLEFDNELLATANRPDEALAQVQAMLFVARSLDGEPCLLSQLIWCAIVSRAVRSVERTLAMGVPKGDLGTLQKLLFVEADADRFTAGIRGERAAMHQLCQRFSSGEASVANWSMAVDASGHTPSDHNVHSPDISVRISAWAIAGTFLPINHAKWLELTTRSADVSKLPDHEQYDSLPNIRGPFDPEVVLTRLQMPAMQKLLGSHLRVRAHLRCASVGLALERYRIQHGRWPTSLAELPSTLPIDPFDGQPLRFKVRPDGVTVYSVGLDKKDDADRSENEKSTFGEDVVFRLYNADQRRLPALRRDEGNDDWELGPEPRVVDR